MHRTFLSVALLVLSAAATSFAETKPPEPALSWQTIADCAAAYQANWRNRLTGFNRSPDMSNMIHVQSQDYQATAIRYYQQETKVAPGDAKEKIGSYVTANVDRYIAMDKAGTLEAFLDTCPQIEPEPPN
jgi:hypothetical protein